MLHSTVLRCLTNQGEKKMKRYKCKLLVVVVLIIIGVIFTNIFDKKETKGKMILMEDNQPDMGEAFSQNKMPNLYQGEREKKVLTSRQKENFQVAITPKPQNSMENFDFDYFIFLVNKIFPKTGDPKFSGFNETLSHSIALDRLGNDLRQEECKHKKWTFNVGLKVSIVIPFVNEPWSTLLRTVISVLKKSPRKQIQEVILVDDQSDRDYLLGTLEKLFGVFNNLKVVRTPFNMGVARSRNYGARHAEGSLIVFLDSHCEVNVGWLEPILSALTEDPTRVVVCSMDHIDSNTLKISGTDPKSQIIFNWPMGAAFGIFKPDLWEKYPITEPIPQVSLMGQVVAVDKKYFFHIGGFPDYFDGWGAEDVDLSIKSWLCGGGVVKCRCSHAIHLQKIRPYTVKNNPRINIKLIAESWLDEFQSINTCAVNSIDSVDTSVLEPIKLLKEKLKCKPFKWLLDTVFPELEVPEPNTTFTHPFREDGQEPLIVNADMKTLRFSHFHYSYCTISVVNTSIKCGGKCLTMKGFSLSFENCEKANTDQIWTYFRNLIRPFSKPELCLTKGSQSIAVLRPCEEKSEKIRFWTQFKPNCIKVLKKDET